MHQDAIETPRLSVIIPAWNEADWLPATLTALEAALAGSGIRADVIVVDNASSDATARVAREAGARVIHAPERGIARARNAGARAALAPYLLFLDADTLIEAVHLREACRMLDQAWAGGGAPLALSDCRYRVFDLGAALWNTLARQCRLAAGCFLFVRADVHASVGGFDEAIHAGEEIGYARRVARLARARGLSFGMIDTPPVRSSGRKTQWFSPWQHALVLTTFLLFPFAGRFRRLSWFWYRRP